MKYPDHIRRAPGGSFLNTAIEVLIEIRKNAKWKSLKCFILTTSDEPIDRQTADNLGVSGYIIKPLKLSNPSKDAFNLLIDWINLIGESRVDPGCRHKNQTR